MAGLAARHLTALLEVVRTMHDVPERLACTCGTGMRTLIGADIATFSDFDLRTSIVSETTDPADAITAHGREMLERHLHDQPLVAHYARTGDGRAHKSSDLLSQSALHRLPFYNECVKPFFGTNYQIAIALVAQPSRVIGLSLSRQRRDFSERDRDMLDLLRPHVAHAVRHAESLKSLAVNGSTGEGGGIKQHEVVVVTAHGRILSESARARDWTDRYFGRSRSPGWLHDEIWRWLEARLRARDDVAAGPSADRLVAHDAVTRLVVRHAVGGDSVFVLMEQQQIAAVARLMQLGLTPREAEVLLWVAEGKATQAIALITGSAARTVEKHLERIYAKLNVENRTAAAAIVHDLVPRDDRPLANQDGVTS
jgi:DNA-binding CsgD family transcriptional regulator